VVSITFGDSCPGGRLAAVSRSLTRLARRWPGYLRDPESPAAARDGPSREGPAAGHRSRPGCPLSPGRRAGRRTATRGCTPGSAVHLMPEYAASAARPWPSVKKPTVRTDRPGGMDAVRYASVDTATHRPAVIHTDTRRDEKKNGPRAAFPQPGGRFRRWWQVLGSNQRRLSRRFYRPLLPVPSHSL
jgi:hypothetical protein